MIGSKKITTFELKVRMALLDRQDKDYSFARQCALLSINRSTVYYMPAGISERDQILMRLLDAQYTKVPFYGVGKMQEYLEEKGYQVGRDHTRTLLRRMGLTAVFPKPNLSKPHPEHQIYPYLLREVAIERPNQVWSTDITYIRLETGFVYLVAIIDWYSRYVLSWRLSNTLENDFCIEALQEALHRYGDPEIFNSDQGSQFTSEEFVSVLSGRGISISMDGKGRAHDNIFVERLWRTVKYENVYLYGYQTIADAKQGLRQYFEFYNKQRYHEALEYKRPWEVYTGIYKTINEPKKIVYKANTEVTFYDMMNKKGISGKINQKVALN